MKKLIDNQQVTPPSLPCWMNRWVVSALAALLLAGCAKEMSVEQARENVSTMTADGTKLTQAEIDRIVGGAIDLLDGNTQTRSGSPRTVASIEPVSVELSGALTRSGETEDEELFYVVNFAGDEGFSVIAADERIKDEIVLFVGHGSLDAAEIENPELVENPGMRIALERLDGYAAASIARYEAWADSMEVVMLNRLVAESPESVVTIEEYLASSEYSGGTRVEPLDSSYTTIEITKGPWTTTSR